MYISDPKYPAVVRMKQIQYAKMFATEYYNTSRSTFIAMAATRYASVEQAYLFTEAVREYDLIQRELNEYFEEVA